MIIKEAVLIKLIEFFGEVPFRRYFNELAINGKRWYLLDEGKYTDEKGKIRYYIVIVESCGYPMFRRKVLERILVDEVENEKNMEESNADTAGV